MATHTMPKSLPSDWIASFKLPSSEGIYESWIVIHPSQSNYHPFCVHKAWYNDDTNEFAYAHGIYCSTENEAKIAFNERIK